MTLPVAREFARYGIRVDDHRARPLRHADAGRAARRGAGVAGRSRCRSPRGWAGPPSTPRWSQHIIENEMLNGEVIRLDGAIRMAPK